MKIKSRFLLLVSLFIVISVYPTFLHAQQGLSFLYFLKSFNGEYFLKSIPFGSQLNDKPGRTDIFKTEDSTLVYSIDRYFAPEGILLSNDGRSVFYSKYSIFNYDGFDENIVLFYKDGHIEKSYLVADLIQKLPNEYRYSLFYSDDELFEWDGGVRHFNENAPDLIKSLIEVPLFSDGGTVFLATKDEELIKFNLDDGSILERLPLKNSLDIVKKEHNVKELFKPKVISSGGTFSMPLLSDGRRYQQAFGDHFGLVQDDKYSDKYGKNTLQLYCLIDYKGNCLEVTATFTIDSLNQEIVDFFKGIKFDPNAVPKILEKKYFFHASTYRIKNKKLAKEQAKIQRENEIKLKVWKQKQDTLDGVYIPKDLEDCFRELDLILSEKSKEEIKKRDPNKFHFGLGRNLRNRWGLWGSSRLQKYFYWLGIDHPDDMSGFIIRNYKKYLKGIPIELEKQLEGHPPRPEIIYENNLDKEKKKRPKQ